MNQIDRLLTIMQRLRDPENGCPWIKSRHLPPLRLTPLKKPTKCWTPSPVKILTIFAVNWAICYSVVFYAQMAQEEGRFDFNDICAAISDKLERRHPHVLLTVLPKTVVKCLPVGSKSKPKSARRKRSIRRWTIFLVVYRL